VDHPVGVGRRLGQALGIIEVARLARPTTSWPAPRSSGTTAEPIHPDAPVTKILMTDLQRATVMSVTVITVDLMSVTVNT
jgi:hypothetical protein